MFTHRLASPINARRGIVLLLALALGASASCKLQEPASIDGLDPDPVADSLIVTPQNVNVPAGDSITFVAPNETVDGTPVSGPVEWTLTGGSGATITSAGLFYATESGTYTVKASRGGKNGRSKVSVTTTTATLTAVKIAPDVLTLQPGATFTFAVSGTMSDGTTAPVTGTWTASGGTVTASGVYTAGTAAGQFRVIVTQQGGTFADTAAVTISAAAPTLQRVEVTPAAVSLASGAVQQFSAVGRMSDNSTSAITVAWSATGGTVTSAGRYTAGGTAGSFRVIATQQGGTKADTATVTITPPAPTLTAVELTPASVNLAPGGNQQFSAIGRMSNGATASVTVTWSATGGTVSGSGSYVAGSTGGIFRVIAVQQGGTLADTSTITIAVPPPTITLQAIELTPASASLLTGATQQFSAVGRMSDNSTSGVAVTWSATGGTVSGSGLYTAGATPGTYRVIAVEQGGSKADTSSITVAAPAPTLSSVVISPATVSLQTSATQQFSAVGLMSDGSTSALAVAWTETGGTITSGGLFTAGPTAGTFRVVATQQGGTKADTATVNVVVPPPTLTAVELTPSSVTLVAGATQQFTTVGRMSDGTTSAVSVTYSETGGTISSGGLYTAGTTPGTYRVIAVQQGGTEADTSSVTITAPAPTLTAVEVSPGTATVDAGDTQQFTAVGRMSDGSTSSVSVTWSETGGTITSSGLYTAGTTAGTFRVIAVRQGGTQADTSSVTISVAAPTLSAVLVTPATVSLAAGATQQFSATGQMSDGSTGSVSVTWSATGGTISTGGLYTAGTTAGTYRVIAVQQGGTKADSGAITIATVPPPSGGVANPALLPLATGQTAQPITALRSAAAGAFGLDPISGVPVVKLTSTTSPSSGSHAPGYANGGPHMSQPWVGSDGKTYYTLALEQGGWLIDIRYDLIGVSDPRVNLRQMPYSPGEVDYAWSMNPATPRILFLLNGGTIVRYNTQAMANAPSGIFPKAVPGGTWFQTQLNDTWMAGMSGTTYWALNTSTGTVINMSQARSGLTHDELHLDMTLPVVYMSITGNDGKNNQPWLLDTDNLLTPFTAFPAGAGSNTTEPANMSDDHATPLRGGMAGTYGGGNPWGGAYVYNRLGGGPMAVIKGVANFHGTGEFYHNAAGGFFGNGTSFNDQWVLIEKITGNEGSTPIRAGVIGMWKVDGSSIRYLAAHDSYNSVYESYPQSQMSPDGKLVFWTSNMNGSSNYQVFLARVPTD